jgi:SAM-dependent methyltransferase
MERKILPQPSHRYFSQVTLSSVRFMGPPPPHMVFHPKRYLEDGNKNLVPVARRRGRGTTRTFLSSGPFINPSLVLRFGKGALSPWLRYPTGMGDGEVLGALRSLARERSSFLISEVGIRLGKHLETGELRRILEPHLDFLGLRGEAEGDNLLVTRLPRARPFLPSRNGLGADERFLMHPVIPGRLQELIEAYIRKKTGKDWNDPLVLDRIRSSIRAQKGEYWDQAGGKSISYGAGYRVLAFLAYQFPASFIQFEHILHDLAADGLLKDRMRILDIGSGPGTVPLAIIDSWSRLFPGEARIYALERETENLEAYRSLVPAFASGGSPVHAADPIRGDLRTIDPGELPRDLDLLVFGNVLNELREDSIDERVALVEGCSRALAADGTLVVIEPADRENSLALRRLTSTLVRRGMTLFAPCTPLWKTACRPDRCWTFREDPPISPPRLMRLLSATDDGYRYMNADIKFSYALLRRDGRTRETFRIPKGLKALRLSGLQARLKRRVNVVVAKMSGDLGGRGDHVFKVCDGTPQKPVFAVVPRHHAARARALLEGRYGEILSLEGVQVRFNPARDAFNLFVDRFTRAGRVGKGREGKESPPGGTQGTGKKGRGKAGGR